MCGVANAASCGTCGHASSSSDLRSRESPRRSLRTKRDLPPRAPGERHDELGIPSPDGRAPPENLESTPLPSLVAGPKRRWRVAGRLSHENKSENSKNIRNLKCTTNDDGTSEATSSCPDHFKENRSWLPSTTEHASRSVDAEETKRRHCRQTHPVVPHAPAPGGC